MAVPGATNNTFFTPSASAADGGVYSVVVSNAGGSVTSIVARVRIQPTTNTLHGVIYSPLNATEPWVAVADEGKLYTSPDLLRWNTRNTGTTANLRSVCVGAGKVVACGDLAAVFVSTNHLSWQSNYSGASFGSFGIAFNGTRFVAVGIYDIRHSTNAVNWTAVSLSSSMQKIYYDVTAGEGYFIAVGEGGKLVRSLDGQTWSAITSGTTSDLRSVAYGNGAFVAAGNSGTLLSSTNGGLSWYTRECGQLHNLTCVRYFNGLFHAFGGAGRVFVSPDSVRWTPLDCGFSDWIYGAAGTNGSSIAVGAQGAIRDLRALPVHHFAWTVPATNPAAGQSFPVTVTAEDVFKRRVTNFNSTVGLRATSIPEGGTNVGWSYGVGTTRRTGDFTLGMSWGVFQQTLYSVRHAYGSKFTIWDPSGTEMLSLPVTSIPGQWVETPLPRPVELYWGGNFGLFWLGCYTDGGAYFYSATSGSDNKYSVSDAYPMLADSSRFHSIDAVIGYGRAVAVAVQPEVSGSFSNGVWTGGIRVLSSGTNVLLQALAADNTSGYSRPIRVNGTTPPAPVRFQEIAVDEYGFVEFGITGIAGQRLVIQASTNLTQWTILGTNVLDSSTVRFLDLESPCFDRRFYRALTVP